MIDCDDRDDTCSTNGDVYQRGDLLLCATHAKNYSPNVSAHGKGWIRCPCGYDRKIGQPCGWPCM